MLVIVSLTRDFQKAEKDDFFGNVALKRPQNHVLFGKMPLCYVATYSSLNLRGLPGNLVHFKEIRTLLLHSIKNSRILSKSKNY